MVVRCRVEFWADAGGSAKARKIPKTTNPRKHERVCDRRVLRTVVELTATYSFYFAQCGAGDDDREREEQECGRYLARCSVRVKSWRHVANALKHRDIPGPHQNCEQDARERAACYQSRAEQCAGT